MKDRELNRRRKASSVIQVIILGGADMTSIRNICIFLCLLLLLIFSSFVFPEAVLFVYNGNPEASLWNLSHKIGQIYFSKAFPEVKIKELVVSDTFKDIFMTEISKMDFDLIFITDPALEEFLKDVPQVFLNKVWVCNGKYHKTYFLRDYQATFLLGIIAGLYSNGKKVVLLIDSRNNDIYFRMVNSLFLGLKETGYNRELEVFEVSNKDLDELLSKLGKYDLIINLSTDVRMVQKLENLGIDNLGFYVDQSMKGKIHNLMNMILNWGVVYSRIYLESTKGEKNSEKILGFEDRALIFSPASFKVSYKIFNVVDYFKRKLISNECKIFKGKLLDTKNHKFSQDFSQEREIFKMDKFLKGVVIK